MSTLWFGLGMLLGRLWRRPTRLPERPEWGPSGYRWYPGKGIGIGQR